MDPQPTASAHHPLRGLRVLELGEGVATPYCSRLLGDAGADVVKVEPPQGDSARREGPFVGGAEHPERSALFAYLNRGKRSVVLDSSMARDRECFADLLQRADVLVHGSPRLSESLVGATPDGLLEAYPALVTVSITAFGESGPHAGLEADELISTCMGGLLGASPGFPDHVLDSESEPPLRANAHVAELTGGTFGAVGGIVAIVARDASGLGDYVEVSVQEAVAALMGWNLAVHEYSGVIVGRHQVPARQAPNHYLPCADGWIALVAFMERHWRGLVELMGNPSWAASEQFATGPDRGANWRLLEPLVVEWLIEQPAQRFFRAAQRAGIPSCPALSISEAIGSEQARAREYLVPTGVQGDDRGRLPGDPMVVDGERRKSSVSVPALGEHTKEVRNIWSSLREQGPRAVEARG